MIKDKPPLETPTERATRMWRNNQITRKLNHKLKPSFTIVEESSPIDWKSVSRVQSKFKKAITELLSTKNDDTIIKYAILIKAQRRKLMIEKLKRLERDNA